MAMVQALMTCLINKFSCVCNGQRALNGYIIIMRIMCVRGEIYYLNDLQLCLWGDFKE